MSNSINTVQITNYTLLVLTNKAMKGFYTFYKDKDIVISHDVKPETRNIFGIVYSIKTDILPYKERLKLCMVDDTGYHSPLYDKIKGYNTIADITHKNSTDKDNKIIYHLDYTLYEKLVRIGTSQENY